MTTVFGTVTAEVSEDFVHKFPTGFDFHAILESASKETGVLLFYSDQHYKFQGLWISMGKVFSILATSLALYGSNSPPNSQESDIKSEKRKPSKCDLKLKDGTPVSENRNFVDETTGTTQNSKTEKSDSMDKSHALSAPTAEIPDNYLHSKSNNVSNESGLNNESEKISSLKIPPRRKRGRPKKNPTTGLSLVKQKMYKFTKLKPNFVRRPLIKPSVPKDSKNRLKKDDAKEEITRTEKDNKLSDSSPRNNLDDVDDYDDDDYDDDENSEIEIYSPLEKIKKKRGRPKNPGVKSYFCSQCEFICDNSVSLSDHKRLFHKANPVKCDICLKVFPNKRYMNRHKISHGEPQHCCDLCGKVYKIKKSLDDHKKTHDVEYTKPSVECPQCCKVYGNSYILKCHIKSEHLGLKKSFLCSICGKSFTTKHSLQEHSNAHTGSKPHVCDVCGKGFNYESALRDHKYTHSDERKFSCVVCDKHFSQRSSLKMHMRIHAVEKKFVCGDCGRGFTQKQALQRHERVHKGFKPFVCKFCRRTFSDSSIVRRHLILVHKIHKDSNCWREDIICKITPTNFRVEKVEDPAKATGKETLPEESEIIPALSEYPTNQKNNFPSKLEYVNYETNSPVPVNTSSSQTPVRIIAANNGILAPQAIDYSDRSNNDHVNPTKVELRVVEEYSAAIPNSWHDGISCDPNQNLSENLTPANNHLSGMAEIHLDSTSQTKDYHHPCHLHRSTTPQYLPNTDLDSTGRCSNVNYPVDIRPDLSTDQSSTSTQWPSIYAYYSQLASQFGMSFNDYQQATVYNVSSQDSSTDHHHQHT